MTQNQRIISTFTTIGICIGVFASVPGEPTGIHASMSITHALVAITVGALVGVVTGIMYARLVNPYNKR